MVAYPHRPTRAITGRGEAMTLVLLILLYFVPSVIGFSRKHHNAAAIFLVNLLLGWTVLGWIASLVWSVTAVNYARDERIVVIREGEQ
jgi:hypothetical protein